MICKTPDLSLVCMMANAFLIAALSGELHIMLLHSPNYLSKPQQIPFREFPHIHKSLFRPVFTEKKEISLEARRQALFVSHVQNR